MLTKDDALTCRVFHEPNGAKCRSWRRNGQTKTWKTRPNEWRVPVKFGLYTYGAITQSDAPYFHTEANCGQPE